MKKILVFSVVAIMCLVIIAGCSVNSTTPSQQAASSSDTIASSEVSSPSVETAQEHLLKVGFVNLTDNDENCYLATQTFVELVQSDDFKEQIGVDQNVQVIALDSKMDIATQTSHVENLLAEGIDMLFLIGADTAGNSISVKACNDAGVPVYMVATEATEGDYKFIGWNEEDYGEYQGKWVAANAEEGAKIFYLYGTPGREAFIGRAAGFKKGIESRPDLEIVSEQATPNNTAEQGMQVTEDWIQVYGDEIDIIASAANLTVVGAVEALKAANMLDQVTVVSSINSCSWDIQQVKDGEVDYAVYVGFDALGELCADVCARTYLGQDVADRELMGLADVTIDNVYEMWPD